MTGSFTAKEKKYLHGRVPKNMDPAAVLQVGQETCQRVERTAAHDKDAAVGALIAGDLPSADDAIGQLCPKQKPLLDLAATGFADGTRKKPAPGTYRALTSAKGCTWKALGAGDKVLASGRARTPRRRSPRRSRPGPPRSSPRAATPGSPPSRGRRSDRCVCAPVRTRGRRRL